MLRDSVRNVKSLSVIKKPLIFFEETVMFSLNTVVVVKAYV